MTFSLRSFRSLARGLLLASLLSSAAIGAQAQTAADQPGKGVKVYPLQSNIAEETFQALLVTKALEQLGYDVQPIREVEYTAAHLAIANGDATFLASHWDRLHESFYQNSGGDAKLWREGIYSPGALQGYLIDKKTAEAHKITHIGQLKDPAIAKLFDTDGDGKANLTGCNPGWGCEKAIESHLDQFQLRGSIQHVQGNYSALIADTITRYQQGQPVFYYTWTPYWVSNVMKPGKDVVWLEVPQSKAAPGAESTALPNGKDYGFIVNNQHIMANRAFIEANPAAAKLFSVMKLPVANINTQNMAMFQGANKRRDIEKHADGWIKAHQRLFDGWLEQARAAAR